MLGLPLMHLLSCVKVFLPQFVLLFKTSKMAPSWVQQKFSKTSTNCSPGNFYSLKQIIKFKRSHLATEVDFSRSQKRESPKDRSRFRRQQRLIWSAGFAQHTTFRQFMNQELSCFSCSSSICCPKAKMDFALGPHLQNKKKETDLNNLKYFWKISKHFPSQSSCMNRTNSRPLPTCVNQLTKTKIWEKITIIRVSGFFTHTPSELAFSQQTLILHYLQPFSAVLSKGTMLSNHIGEVLTLTSPHSKWAQVFSTTRCLWWFSVT